MLTGRETIPAAFAAAAWSGHWTGLAVRVRHLALALGECGTVAAPLSDAASLAVVAAGGVLDFDAEPATLDEDALAAAGRAIDEREPDAFERRWGEVDPGDPAAVGDGGAVWSHRALLWAARSFARGVSAGPGCGIRLDDPLDGVRTFVLRTLVPVVSGATVSSTAVGVRVCRAADAVEELRPIVTGDGGAIVDAHHLVLVTGDAGVAVEWFGFAGVRAEPLVAVPGCAGPVATDRPLPGVTIGVNDDGEVLVRAGSIAEGRRGPDGWLHTGTHRA